MAIFSTLYLLSSNAISLRRDKSILFSRISIIILLYCFFISSKNIFLSCIEKGLGLYGGLFESTANSQIFHLFLFFIGSFIILITGFFPRKSYYSIYYNSFFTILKHELIYIKNVLVNRMGEQFRIIEYPLILLFVIIGGSFLLSTGDVVSIFLSIELQSYALYLISTIYRNSELSTSGGLTYFLLGGLSSCFILLSTGLIYSNSGITYLDNFYIVNNLSDTNISYLMIIYDSFYIISAFIIISVGFLFKVSAAPFHFWSPDVYDAIPTIVTTFVAIVAKISIFIFLLELVYYTSNIIISKFNWTYSLLLSSLFSMIIGTVVGLSQFRIKRLFAYSSISHVGFLLLALTINSIESVQAFIFYLIQYILSNLNGFFILLSLGYYLYYFVNNNNNYDNLLDKNNSPIQLIDQIKGYFYLNPFLALSFAITIFSFIGIPPLIGFFGKQLVLSSALDKGYVFISLIGILTSVTGAVYYLNMVKQVFFDNTEYVIYKSNFIDVLTIKNGIFIEDISLSMRHVLLSTCFTLVISLLSLIILLFIFTPSEWLSIANILALILYNS